MKSQPLLVKVLYYIIHYFWKYIFSHINSYSGDSCESLIPIPQREDFSKFNLGPEFTQEELDMSEEETLDAPKELNARNPPFGLELDFNRYRKGKVYKGKKTINICIIIQRMYE